MKLTTKVWLNKGNSSTIKANGEVKIHFDELGSIELKYIFLTKKNGKIIINYPKLKLLKDNQIHYRNYFFLEGKLRDLVDNAILQEYELINKPKEDIPWDIQF